MYRIAFSYNTGSSFHTEKNIEEFINLTWNSLEIAEENLKRIKEHYEFYCKLHSRSFDCDYRDYQIKRDEILLAAIDKPWFSNDDYYEHSLNLLTDAGNIYKYSAQWCGYFESLNWAEIRSKNHRVSFSDDYEFI
jgi:hypothetical protein